MARDVAKPPFPTDAPLAAESWLAALVEQSPDAIAGLSKDGRIFAWNRAAERLTGHQAATMLGRSLATLWPGDGEQAWAPLRAALAAGRSVERPEAVWLRSDGRPLRLSLSLWSVRGPDGKIAAVSALARDVSARSAAEEALKLSEERYRIVSDSVQGLIARIDRDHRYTFLNAEGGQWYGLAPDEVVGRHMREIIGVDRYEAIVEHFRRVLELGEQVAFENRIDRPGAPHRDMLVTLVPDRDAAGAIQGCYSLAMDITKRKRAETALRESEAKLRLAVEATALGLWDFDIRSGALVWSGHLKQLFGLAADAPIDFDRYVSLLHPDDRDMVLRDYEAALDPSGDGRFGFEHRIQAADGAERWLLAAGQVVFDADGRPVRAIGTARDVTERKADDRRQRLLMAELDHRVKNVLATVQSIATRTLNADAAAQALLGRIAALAHAHSILSAEEWRGAELAGLLEAVLTAHRTGRSRVSLEGPSVMLPPKLAQSLALMLHELTTNAAKYGALSVETGRVRLRWEVSPRPQRLRLVWRESEGPPVGPPARRGFGSMLIEQSLAYEFLSKVDVQYRPEGLRCEIDLPLTPSETD
jgi:PAS domain S-box-containing protein